jgi:hypothetical protein
VRWTPHTPQKLNDFPTDSATYVPVLALPVSAAPRAASSSARCIHVSSSTQPGEHCTVARPSPSQTHVLPHVHLSVNSDTLDNEAGGVALNAATGNQHGAYRTSLSY